MSELEKMDREEMMKEMTSKLTYEGVTPGSASVTNIATPSNTMVTETVAQTNTTIVRPAVPVKPAKAGQPGQEASMLVMFSSLLTVMNAQSAGGNDDAVDVSKFTPRTAGAPL
jgi:hypothetical protein